MDLKIQLLSGALSTASGGTRISVKLDRPWQTDIIIDPANCPFETKPQVQVASYERQGGGWQVLENIHTPFSWHRMIIPRICWTKDQVRTLGGEEAIGTALCIASKTIRADAGEFWLGVHVGPAAGQTLGHLHYHLLKPLSRAAQSAREDRTVEYIKSASLVLFEDHGHKVVLGGCRAGQCFIVPLNDKLPFGDNEAVVLARVLHRLVTLYNKKFLSTNADDRLRLPPDFIISARFLLSRLVYATYIPILNNWGFTEYVGLLEERPLILPWPHEESARYLGEP
jgi:hypothetical protein